jgi:hypothetical protein
MNRPPILLASFVLAVAAATAPAQTPDHLVGVTRVNGNLRHVDHVACGVLGACAPAGFPSAAGMPGDAGGTAWDPIHGGAWISNGQFVACVDDACNYLCAPFAVPGMGGAVVIAGLEVVESRNELWLVDSAGMLRAMNLTCPPTPGQNCAVAFLDPTFTTTGLAVDELKGLVFYARFDPATGANVIAFADLAAPCIVLNGSFTPPCAQPTGIFTGLACDAATSTLYATDGLRTVSWSYQVIGGGLVLNNTQCCAAVGAGADPMIGLAVRPGRATSNGVACANGSCPACPMAHTLHGDPVLGNGQFGFELAGARAGGLAWCAVGLGPCALPGAIVPPLCGPIYATPVLGTLGFAVAAGGGGACSGTSGFSMPLPAVAGFAGIVLSSQCLVLCVTPAGVGTSVSNCLSFELQGV